ncbi:MAG: hypothetical protein GAK35_04275 [Herbaspirillum frisingense]|uniref:Uncharacterized protein n=1 Tax=Herbaspirillum frisingense TaxID=92645 RepID=A0A7V8FSM9_9BURK|nr:MAG: hypothetical protein GAK35_04275 [Herbaspirillum frisingense]
MNMKIRRMTQEAFDQAVNNAVFGTGQRSRPFAELTLAMAKEVLVDGRQAAEVAKENGKHPPSLFRALDKITSAWQASSESLVKVELTLPGSLASELQKFSEIYAAKLDHPEAADVMQRIMKDLSFASRKLQD